MKQMSMKLGLNRFQEVLIMGLMILLVFAMSSNMQLPEKIGIGVIIFVLILLTTVANQLLEQAKERSRQ